MIFLLLVILFISTIFVIYWGSMHWLKVSNHTLYFDDLPDHLEGFRILHISDLHSNSKEYANPDIWHDVERLDFDIAVITGDIILGQAWNHSGPILELEPQRPYLEALAARVPTFFVEGNHEAHHYRQMLQFMDEVGIVFLRNETTTLEVNGGSLEIIGTKDLSTLRRIGFDDFNALFAAQSDNFQVVLTHQPQLFDRFKDSGINLAFAGHTHGGQLRLPFFPTIYAPNQGFWPTYGAGIYRHGDAVMHVSSGIGTTYFPIRFWNRPEVSIIELRRN